MTREVLLAEATRRLVAAANPKRIILFGSQARDEADDESDFDFVVVVEQVGNRWDEALRLRRALRPLPLAADVLVYTEREVEERGGWRGTALYEALTEGRVLHAA